MLRRKYWIPISVFIVAIVGVCLYMLTTQTPKDPILIYKPVEPLPKSEVKAPEGDTSQGGHFHADGTWHEGAHEPVEVPAEVDTSEATAIADPSQPAMQLTYHTELLKSDPVEALRQQGKERGHWSADYPPPFPLDDTEAMEYARAIYDYIYYGHTIPMSEHGESPEFQRAAGNYNRMMRTINKRYPLPVTEDEMLNGDWRVWARNFDLTMLTWAVIDSPGTSIEDYRNYKMDSLIVRNARNPHLPELGETR